MGVPRHTCSEHRPLDFFCHLLHSLLSLVMGSWKEMTGSKAIEHILIETAKLPPQKCYNLNYPTVSEGVHFTITSPTTHLLFFSFLPIWMMDPCGSWPLLYYGLWALFHMVTGHAVSYETPFSSRGMWFGGPYWDLFFMFSDFCAPMPTTGYGQGWPPFVSVEGHWIFLQSAMV